MLELLVRWYEKRTIKRAGGIPIVYFLYKPWLEVPNVFVMIHPDIGDDAVIKEHSKIIANRVREIYPPEELKRLQEKYGK